MQKFDTTKVKKFLLTLSFFLVIFNFAIYIFAPNAHNTIFKNYHGSISSWYEGVILKNPEYTKTQDEVLFSSDEIIEISEDIYITGVRGISNKITEIGIFSKKAVVKKNNFQYNFRIVGSGDNSVIECTQEVFLNGYGVDMIIDSPEIVSNNIVTIELLDADFSLISSIDIDVDIINN